MVSDEDLETIERLKARLGESDGSDDEEQGYRQGLEDAARVLQGLKPKFRGVRG
jgi:hypothetical protein